MGPSRPVLVPSCSRAFPTESGLDGQKQTSWPLPILSPSENCHEVSPLPAVPFGFHRFKAARAIARGFAKGWFPKGWFWRMFPRNENQNEGTFAKTTLLETALLSPSDPFWCWQKGGFQKGGFGGCSAGTKTGTRVRSPKPPFYETALLSPSEWQDMDHYMRVSSRYSR